VTNLSGRKHIVHIVGTRPQFPKLAPVWRALNGSFKQTVIHTGQHYDDRMSKEIIEDTGCHIDLTLPQTTSSGGEVTRQARMDVLGGFLEMHKPDLVMVYGDCNTSLDAALAAESAKCKFAHVEAGLRCRDYRMIEEHNRIEIDTRADILYVPSVDAVYNLAREGRCFSDIQFVGNVMADTYYWRMSQGYTVSGRRDFGLVTMHRPENVDDPVFMRRFVDVLGDLNYPIIFPKHPRVKLESYVPYGVQVVEPMRYREFNAHLRACTFLITDSGGLQEEATITHTPCLTMRPSTERPVTITEGTNELSTIETLSEQVHLIRENRWKQGSIPVYWDGQASERIACHLRRWFQ
jgi:UDP-N-acetylglucosamine 2-epimerase (non-hydrolysing)